MEIKALQCNLPEGWRRVPMKDVGRWFGGGTPSKANPHFWTGGTIPWVSPKDMKRDKIGDAQDHITEDAVAQSATNLVEAGSVLIVVRSGILQHTLPVAIAQREVALNQDLKAVKPLDTISSDYLALALKAFEREILHTCTKTGTTVQSLEMPVFLRFTLPLAPLSDQRRIVAEIEKQFTRLEAGVAALKRVQANLKRYRAAVLKAACEGRLVETEAELARKEDRPYETGAALLTRILSERRKNWQGRGKYKEPVAPEADGLIAVPGGWAWATLDQLLGLMRNGISVKPDAESGLPILRISAVRALSVNLSEVRYLNAKMSDYPDYILTEGDLLFTRYNGNPNLVGVCGVVPPLNSPLVHPDKIIRCKLLSFSVLPEFVAIIANVGVSRDYLAKRVRTTAGQSGISGGDLKGLPVPIPPVAEQTRIVAEVERRLSVIEGVEATVAANLKRAARLRQAILQKAFSGGL